MKNFILVIIISFIFSSTSFAKWVKLGNDKTGTAYYENNSVRRVGEKLYAYHLIDLPTKRKIAEGIISSMMTFINIDCNSLMNKILNHTGYSENMGTGKIVFEFNFPENEFEPTIPGSIGYNFNKMACSKY